MVEWSSHTPICQRRTITMDSQNYITEEQERKRGQHLQREDRCAIQRLKRLGYSNRAIAREIRCSPTTVGNEHCRGTPPRQCNKGRVPGYSAKCGHAVYSANRTRNHKPHKLNCYGTFAVWVDTQVARASMVSCCLCRPRKAPQAV